MALDAVKEGSVAIFLVSFENPDGGALTPTSIHYQVGMADGTVVIEEDEIDTPAASVQITIPKTAHVIADDEQQYETRVLHVVADKDLDTEWRWEHQYQVENLVMIPAVGP